MIKIYWRLIANKQDFYFLGLYLFLLFIYPKSYISFDNIEFIRGIVIYGKEADNFLKIGVWGFYALIPLLYLVTAFEHYFQCSYYYFIRVKDMGKWFLLYLIRCTFIIFITLILKSIVLMFSFHIDWIINMNVLVILFRDLFYYMTFLSVFLLLVCYLKKGLAIVLFNSIYFIILIIGSMMQKSIFLLSIFYQAEMIIYLIVIISCFLLIKYRLKNNLDKVMVD